MFPESVWFLIPLISLNTSVTLAIILSGGMTDQMPVPLRLRKYLHRLMKIQALYAHVTEIEYNITYNLYQTPIDSAPTEKQQKYTVSKGNSNSDDPRLKNYIFLGWFDENGTEYKTIPIGTTGDITLKPYYTSERNLAVSKVDNNPIILEDQNTNVVYFTYEIGEIRNIPLNADKPFWEIQSVAGLSQQVSETYTTSITNSEAENVSKTISDMTSNSSTWTLSENWNDVTTVNKTWAKSIERIQRCAKQRQRHHRVH